MRRRLILLLTAMTVALVMGSGVALAAQIVGTPGGDLITGTAQDDDIYGLSGIDTLRGRGVTTTSTAEGTRIGYSAAWGMTT
jgi:hypothetical protein